MALLTNGYWNSQYWAGSYWDDNYWPDVGIVVALKEAFVAQYKPLTFAAQDKTLIFVA